MYDDDLSDQERIDILLHDLYYIVHVDKDIRSITVNLDIKVNYATAPDIYGNIKIPGQKYRVLSFPLTEGQIKQIHALDYEEFLKQFAPLIERKIEEVLFLPENLPDTSKYPFTGKNSMSNNFIFPGELCVYANVSETSTSLEDIVNILKSEKQLKDDKNIIYFVLSIGNKLYMYAGVLIPYDENINTSDEQSFLKYVPAFAHSFSAYYMPWHTKVNSAITRSHKVNFPSLYDFSYVYICKFGDHRFLAQVPINLTITQTPSDEDKNRIFINLKMMIGSAEFHDRISDLSELEREKSIDRLLTRAFQQRNKNHNVKPDVSDAEYEPFF